VAVDCRRADGVLCIQGFPALPVEGPVNQAEAAMRTALGFLDPGTIATAIAYVNRIVGLFDNPADGIRREQNEEAFKRASSGDNASMLYLKARTGRFGLIAIPYLDYALNPHTGVNLTPDNLSGWATENARAHASGLYDQYMAIVENRTGGAFGGTAAGVGLSAGVVLFGGLALAVAFAPRGGGRRPRKRRR
jgi:hypothetical protein